MKNFKGFAVVDLETTGLEFNKGDKIIQVAFVLTDIKGNIESKWSSYVNPERRVSSTNIHSITDKMVTNEPTFDEIAPKILDILKDRVLVAHRYEFDGSFLEFEFQQIGLNFQTEHQPHFCTKINAILWLPQIINHTLSNCARAYKIDFNGNPHDATADAEVTAKLLQKYLQENPNNVYKNVKPSALNIENL